MINKFVASKFSGYIAIASVVVVLGMVWYIFNEGKRACENSVKSAQLDDTIEVQRNTQDVKIKEQSSKIPEIDKALCDMGIVRGNIGCDL